jgi:hypothetical protein
MKKSALVFMIVPIICCGLGIFFVGAGIYSINSTREVIPALIFFACALPLWITARRERDLHLQTYDDGLVYRRNNQETAACWDDVTSVYENIEIRSVNGIPVGTFYKYTIELKDGSRIKTSERLAAMELFSRALRGQYFSRLFAEAVEQYKTGNNVKFGELAVNQAGIIYRKRYLARDDLRQTQIVNGQLKTFGAGGKKAWAAIPLAKIPNNSVLMALLEDIF